MAAMFSSELAFRAVKFEGAGLQLGRHILHLDASHGPSSLVAHGAKAVASAFAKQCPDLRVERLDLWDGAVRARMEYNLEHVRCKMARLSGSTAPEHVDGFASIEELALQAATARALVVSAPVWNYGAPWVLKQYFDCILHPGLTFRESASGPQGLLGGGRPLLVLTSAGGDAGRDHLTPWLQDVSAMLGFSVPTVVSATGASSTDRSVLLDSIARDAEGAAQRVASLVAARAPGSGVAGAVGQLGLAASASDPAAGSGDPEDAAEIEGWTSGELLAWLRAQGGLSEDALDSIEAVKADGQMWLLACRDDWADEEIALEDADISRLLELKARYTEES